MDINNGGPVFPVSPEESRGKVSSIHGGMTIRDWFAGMALQGEISTQCESDGWFNSPSKFTDAAEKCYALADAMLGVGDSETPQ
jgi:hypothetical protein